jgi:hypothetical protein
MQTFVLRHEVGIRRFISWSVFVTVILGALAFYKRFVVGMSNPPDYPLPDTFVGILILNGAAIAMARADQLKGALGCAIGCSIITIMTCLSVFLRALG